jgi:SAM-dependent methyltransferase
MKNSRKVSDLSAYDSPVTVAESREAGQAAEYGAGHLKAAFREMWRGLRTVQEHYLQTVTSTQLELLRARVRADEPVDYEREGEVFAAAFLGVNYWKAATALIEARPRHPQRIVDLGAGAGSAGLAALAYAGALRPGVPVFVDFVDSSPGQLQVAQAVLYVLQEQTPLQASFTFSEEDAVCWARAHGDYADLLLASHLLTENRREIGSFAQWIPRALSANGHLMVIERGDDLIGDLFEEESTAVSLPFSRRTTSVSAPEFPSREDRDWSFQWLSTERPSSEWMIDLVSRYFQAWNGQNEELLPAIFTQDATYKEKAFQRPLVGLAAIVDYWRHVVGRQVDVKACAVSTSYHGTMAFVEWVAEFKEDTNLTKLSGSLVLTCDPIERKVIQLREHFRTSRQSLP